MSRNKEFSLMVAFAVIFWGLIIYVNFRQRNATEKMYDRLLMHDLTESMVYGYYNVLTPQERDLLRPWMQDRIKSYGGDPNILVPNNMIPPGYKRKTFK